LHGTDITVVGKDNTYKPIVEFSINKSDGVTSVSADLRKETFETFRITNEITVIPNFVDMERFHKQKKEHFKKIICPNDEKLIVHVSNFRKVKRIDDIIHVFGMIRPKMPSKLLLIGDGPERQTMELLCRKLELCDDIRFIGKLDAVEEVLSVADLFFMPSEKESFGLAALEAMACEVPVISTNTGGIPELVIQGKTGFMSEIGDREDMAKNALHVLDEDNLPTFKANALARAKEFDIKQIVPQYEAYYEKIIAKVKAEVL
jgi:N-acetyl-alpha-D-glucosaminyl L-malate synthase BshA